MHRSAGPWGAGRRLALASALIAATSTTAFWVSAYATASDGPATIIPPIFTGTLGTLPVQFDIVASTTAVDFGSVLVGQSKVVSVTLTNTGGDPFGPINMFGGAPPSDEFNASQNCQATTLPAGGSCQLSYTFSPTGVGPFSDSSNFTVSDTPSQSDGKDFAIALKGFGSDGTFSVAVAPASLDFGVVAVGSAAERIATVTNTGMNPFGPITVTGAVPTVPEFELTDACSGITLAPAATCALTYRFEPSAAQVSDSTVQLTVSQPAPAASKSQPLALHGAGVVPPTYVALPAPARVLDTRPGRPVTAGAPDGTGPLGAGETIEVQIGGVAGVPEQAGSAALSVTAVGPTGAGHLTVFPCGEPVPTASNVNFTAGQTIANAVITRLGQTGADRGKACVFAHAATDVIVDVAGYFPALDRFVPLAVPARLTDTRPGRPVVAGAQTGTGPLPGQQVLQVDVAGLAGVPAGTAAVALNVTAVGPSAPGHLALFPCDAEPPTASNVNYAAGQTIANAVITGIATAGPNVGEVCVYTHATTDVVVDIVGYFAAPNGFVALGAPERLADTRPGRPVTEGAQTGTGPLSAQQVLQVAVTGLAGVPADATSVVVNVTAAGPGGTGHLTVFPCDQPAPTASNVNYVAGQTIAGLAISRLGASGPGSGKVCVRAHAATDVIVDLAGYFTG